MASISKCKNCGSLSYTQPEPCVTQQCLQSNKCSEIIDAACISFTGNDLLCGPYTVIAKDTNIETAIQNLFAEICNECNLTVDITAVEGTGPSLTAQVTGGTEPYTYAWSFAQGDILAHDIISDTNTNTLDLDPVSINSILTNTNYTCQYATVTYTGTSESAQFEYKNCEEENIILLIAPGETSDVLCISQIYTPSPEFTVTETSAICDQRQFIKSTLFRLDVTDAKGCTKTSFYDYSCDCYNQIIDTPEVNTEYAGGDIQLYEFPYPDVWFLDREDQRISCEELKNFGCTSIIGYPQIDEFRDISTLFKKESVCYLLGRMFGIPESLANCNLNDYSTTPWLPGNLADQTVIYKGRLTVLKADFGCAPYTKWAWKNQKYTFINNKTLFEIIPTVKTHFEYLPAVADVSQLPTTGLPGQIIVVTQPFDKYYGWDPRTNEFTNDMGNAMSDTESVNRAQRDAFLKALGELMLAQWAFLIAVDLLPLHRFKREIL